MGWLALKKKRELAFSKGDIDTSIKKTIVNYCI
jgi:hypothetical protein